MKFKLKLEEMLLNHKWRDLKIIIAIIIKNLMKLKINLLI